MTQGKIKKWFPDRASGFIRADDSTSHDVFLHITQIANRFSPTEISEGDRIEFDIAADREGRLTCAKGAKILSKPGDECEGLNRYLGEDEAA